MKIKDLKHNHSLTDLLKVLIFSILMLAPMIAIAVKCAYVVVNKNAKDSYSGANGYSIQYKYETNELNSDADLKVGNIYKFDFKTKVTNTGSGYSELLKCQNVYLIDNVSSKITYTLGSENNGILTILYNHNNQLLYVQNDNGSYLGLTTINNLDNYMYVVYLSSLNSAYDYTDFSISDYNIIEGVNISNEGTLDNVFYYAIDEMSDNQLFSWTKNTGIYTGIKAMTDNLEITTDVIAVLITYWTLLTVIYVIIDIVLKGFTLLTHMFQKENN